MIKEFLEAIGIDKEPYRDEAGTYVIDIDNYDEIANCQSILDDAVQDELLKETSISKVDSHEDRKQYVSDDYVIDLVWEFENETGKLTVIER